MRLQQQNNGFSPIAIVLETQRDLEVFWDMVLRIKRCSDKDEEYEMACTISDWISNEAHLCHTGGGRRPERKLSAGGWLE